MPRPGPRPYECVKRAWHSETHQPMRGSIIQQILRLAIETHCSATKKNKEWRDKILIVIVKAEEIMYSKANSEIEYMNPVTLWDRVNDAINTIIRRDESTETGELLPPCVEAALNLGCYPVRSSRSQRHCNPRTYLAPRAPEPVSSAPRILDEGSEERCPRLLPVQTNHHCNSFLSENNPYGQFRSMRIETKTPPNLGQVYPLYYGIHYQNAEPRTGSLVRESIISDTVFVGRPIGTSSAEPGVKSSLQNLFSSPDVGGKRIEHQGIRNCDLSLRLGLFSDSCLQVEKNSILQKSEVLRFPPERTLKGHFEPFSGKLFIDSEGDNLGETVRKRKATFGGDSDDLDRNGRRISHLTL
ncbi:kinase-inducible domain interacting8 [Hibiscus trionum]|uniref:Kinase-inducible domain interacting8 n=1 Tax=Hibiscus trionum TaxID=183268 RepID=A0A9W7MWW7_HIBTR|nr:kinase-inducible domain interacting8 [Hibiscus trionum]